MFNVVLLDGFVSVCDVVDIVNKNVLCFVFEVFIFLEFFIIKNKFFVFGLLFYGLEGVFFFLYRKIYFVVFEV